MEIKIDETTYELQFGLGFIRAIDEVYKVDLNGLPLGVGVESIVPQLIVESPVVLFEVIKAATSHLNSKPSNEGIEKFLEEKAANDELSPLFQDVLERIKESSFLKAKVAMLLKQLAPMVEEMNG